MIKYTQQESTQTLKEGLREYYSINPSQVKEYSIKIPLLMNHDITHIIFGLGTSIEEESLLDTWTIRGTNISWKQIYEYAFDKDFKELTKEIVKDEGGWYNVIKVVLKCIPHKIKIHFNRIPMMKKKWPYSNVTDEMMSKNIKDLRNEYGIKVLAYK